MRRTPINPLSCAGQYFWPVGSLLSYIKNYSSDYKNFYISRNNNQLWICRWSLLFSCEYCLKRKVAKEKSSFEKIEALSTNRWFLSEKKNDLKIFYSVLFVSSSSDSELSNSSLSDISNLKHLSKKKKVSFCTGKCSGKLVQFPASFWPAYDWKNRIWPIKVERTDVCESYDMSFLEN